MGRTEKADALSAAAESGAYQMVLLSGLWSPSFLSIARENVKTIYRQDARRITVHEAKHMIFEASAIDARVDDSEKLRQHGPLPSHSSRMLETGTPMPSGLKIESNFVRLCSQLLIEPQHLWHSPTERYEPDGGYDAVFTISHKQFSQLVELHGGTVEIALAPQAKPRKALTLAEAQSELKKIVWYDSVLHAHVWRKLPAVKAADAALLLCELSPALTTLEAVKFEKISNLQVSYVDCATMYSAFESLDATPRSLADWRLVAEELNLRHHKWLKGYEDALELLDPANKPARSAPPFKGIVWQEQPAFGPTKTKPHLPGTAGSTLPAEKSSDLWALKPIIRADSFRSALHRHLDRADREKRRPSAREVMDAWLTTLPTGILKVLDDQVDYLSAGPDGVASVTKRQIQNRILGMTEILDV